LVLGSSIFNNDIIISGVNSKCNFIYDDKFTSINMSENTSIKLIDDNFSRVVDIDYGDIFIENAKTLIKSYVVTDNNEIFMNNSEVWIKESSLGNTEILSLGNDVKIFNYKINKTLEVLPLKLIHISNSGEFYYDDSVEYPDFVNKERNMNFNYVNAEKIPVYLNSYDLIPVYGNRDQTLFENVFNIHYNAGTRMMNSLSYLNFSFYPYYRTDNFSIGGSIEFYYNPDDGLLDNWDDIVDIFEKIDFTYQYKDNNDFLLLNGGKIESLTFGHGYLVNGLSNTFNYPFQRNFGLNLFYKLDNDFFEFKFFTPSIRDYFNGGGLIGFHSSLFISHKFPLTLGVGLLYDLNQFSLSNTTYNFSTQSSDNLKRGIGALEIDYNYKLVQTMNLEVNVFGELVGLWFPQNIYYIQKDGLPYTDDLKWRKGAWGMLGPGISVKLNNRYEFKIAFNMNSAGFQPEYFNKNYLNSRAIYYSSSNQQLAFPLINEQIDMFNAYAIDSDSTEFLIPKDMYPILNNTFNAFPVFGFSGEFLYTFKKIVDFSSSASLFIQKTDNRTPGAYYSLGANVKIKDNVLKDVSFIDFYLRNTFFWSADDLDKMLYGAKIGFKLPMDLSLVLDFGQVCYDYNLINDIKEMFNAGIEIKMNF
tara:strand:- start:13278 stop:15203 length:1926 start_codon:yes stop_codon:yes gene_type:complete